MNWAVRKAYCRSDRRIVPELVGMNWKQTGESSGDAAMQVLPGRLDGGKDRLGTAVESCLVAGAVVRVLSRVLPRLERRGAVKMTE